MTLSTITKPLAAAILAVSTLFVAQSAEAAPGDHLDQLALQLQGQSRNLIGEFRLHYSHTQEYRHLMSDAYDMYRLAGHIHALAHTNQSLHHLQSDLAKLDQLHHHIHGLVDHREVHPHGGHAHGDTGHVHGLLTQMESTLHHMLQDVQQLNSQFHGGGGHGYGGFQTSPGFGHGSQYGQSSGFQFRRGGVTIRFGH